MNELSRITVLGAGTLGSQIAYQIAYSGFDVVAYDVDAATLVDARKRLALLADRYVREVEGATDGERAQKALDRITLTYDLSEAAASADLVIEAVPEVPAIKRDIFARLGEVAPEKTIFATNTSSLLPSTLMKYTGRPDRFLALHFANKLWVHNTAEVMGTEETDPAVHTAVMRFAASIGMVPIDIKKERAGYILNSLLMPLLKAAGELLTEGIAEPSAVDEVWRIGTGATYGPFQMLDIVGLTTAHHIAARGDEKQREFARLIKAEYLDRGKLGLATGEGFYSYPREIQ
ncbi:3-hydroxyacyl-CoA dehydrogenase [Streptomyces sp. NPDC087659]|uniref:3-hydroxyacyl-CoA dehydrogenase n=1 Tax=Streptomyces sp. NPDC087659 TaxID=3365801 RepID=UPI0037F403E6